MERRDRTPAAPRPPHITAGCPGASPRHAAPTAALPARGDERPRRELRHPRAWIQLRHRFFIHCGREWSWGWHWHGQGGRVPHSAVLSPSRRTQPGHPRDSARTGNPPASPWGAHHGQSGPDVGESLCLACTCPCHHHLSHHRGGTQGDRRWSSCGYRGRRMPACVTATSPQTHTLPGASFLTLSPCAWGCVTPWGWRGAGRGHRGPWGHGDQRVAHAQPKSAHRQDNAGIRSAPGPGDRVTVPAEPHSVGRDRDRVPQGP